VPGDVDTDDVSKYHCRDEDNDGCDDCSSGIDGPGELPDPTNDGLDSDAATDTDTKCNAGETECSRPETDLCDDPIPTADDRDGDGVIDSCDNCPNDCNSMQSDHDGDGYGDKCDDPCPYSDDNDADGDGRCLINGHHVGSFSDAADEIDEQTEPAIGLTGRTPFVAYLTNNGHIKVVAVKEDPPGQFGVQNIGEVNPIEHFGTTNVGFRVSGATLVVAPRTALTDEGDYDTYPFSGLKVVPFRVTTASVEIEDNRATYFDCYDGRYGAPGVARLERWWFAEPSPWVVAQVTCPTYSAFSGTTNRRVYLGGGIDEGPTNVASGLGPTTPAFDILFGDDRAGVVHDGSQFLSSSSVHAPFDGLAGPAGFTGWRGNLSPSGDAMAVQNIDSSKWQVYYRRRPTPKLSKPPFRRVSWLSDDWGDTSVAAADNRMVLWSEPTRVGGVHPQSGVRIGFDLPGNTFAAKHHVVVRQGPLDIWYWEYADTCPRVDGPETDTDLDGVADVCDLCPTRATSSQADADGDGVGDACDLCPYLTGSDPDSDGDGHGDHCDFTVVVPDLCPLPELSMDEEASWTLVCDGDGDDPFLDYDDPGDDCEPDFSDTVIYGSETPETPSRSVDMGAPPDCCDDSALSLYLPVVDRFGNPTCEAGALPVCATLEGRSDFERPLRWADNCTDAGDNPGIVFNYPEEGPSCLPGQVTLSGGISCTMLPVNEVDPSAGCYYLLGAPVCSPAVTGRTMHPEDRPPYLVSKPGFAICATGDVDIENAVTVTDDMNIMAGHVAAGGDLAMRNASAIYGSVLVGEDLLLRNTALIGGSATVGGVVTMEHQSAVWSGVTAATWPGDICTCGRDLEPDMGFVATWNDNQRLTDEPTTAQYLAAGFLTVTNGGVVTLAGGDYYLTGLRLRNGSRLESEPGAHVRIYVAGPISIENASDLNFPPLGARLDIVSNYAGEHQLFNGSDNVLFLYAPNASLRLRNAGEMYGGVVAQSIYLENAGYLVRDVDETDDGLVADSCQWEVP